MDQWSGTAGRARYSEHGTGRAPRSGPLTWVWSWQRALIPQNCCLNILGRPPIPVERHTSVFAEHGTPKSVSR